MTLLVFAGKPDALVCTPPNELVTEGKYIGLVYVSTTKAKVLITGNFVKESPFNLGTKRIVGISHNQGVPFYVPLKANVTEFKLTLAKYDSTKYQGTETLLVIARVCDSPINHCSC